MATIRLKVSPKLLTWAVERLGQDVKEYALQNENFKWWLTEEKQPTFKQIKDFAKKFYLPLGYMFLEEPPQEEPSIAFFRKKTNAKQDVNVNDTINILKYRQEWLREYLKTNDFQKLDFVGKFKDYSSNNLIDICKYIKNLLGLKDNWAFEFSNVREALNKLVAILEDIGVIVIFNSVVGNNTHREIDVATCRGFALVDDYAPFIFINAKDSKVAQIFTLVHEFAHILIGYTAGISNIDINNKDISKEERFCNKIASNFLLPKCLFLDMWRKNKDIDILSKRFKVSRFVIGIRAVELKLLSFEEYKDKENLWAKEEYNDTKNNNGGNYYAIAIKRTSRTFLIHLYNALNSGQLLHLDAYKLAGMKGESFHNTINSEYFLH